MAKYKMYMYQSRVYFCCLHHNKKQTFCSHATIFSLILNTVIHFFFYFKWKTMSKKKICQLFVVCLLIYSTSSLQERLSTVFFLGNFKKSNEKRNSIYLMFSFIETYQLRFMWVMHIQYTLDLKRADSFFAYRG